MNAIPAALLPLSDEDRRRLQGLCGEFNTKRDRLLHSVPADQLVYEAFDLDLGAILTQLVPVLLTLLSGGSPIPIVLAVIKMFVPQLIKNTELAELVVQIVAQILQAWNPRRE